MRGIGPFKWIDPGKSFEPSLKNHFTLGLQRCRNALSGLRRPNIKLISAKIKVVLPPQPGADPKQAGCVERAKNCLIALVDDDNTLCEKLDDLYALAVNTARKNEVDWLLADQHVSTALITATESISKDGLLLLRDRAARAYHSIDEKARAGVEGHMLRDLHKHLNHRLSAEKGLLPKGLHSTRSRNFHLKRAALLDRIEAQDEGRTVGSFKFIATEKDATIARIKKIVDNALNVEILVEDVCDNVISGSEALVESYRNDKAALRRLLVQAFTEEKFDPQQIKRAINKIGTVGKSIEAEAAKHEDSFANRQVMRRARILILLHDAFYMSQGQDPPGLKNDGTRGPTYWQLVNPEGKTAERADVANIPFVNPTSFVSAGIFNQLSSFGFLTGSSLGFLTVNLRNLKDSITVDQRRALFAKQLRGMSKGDLRDLHAPLQYYRAMLDGVATRARRQQDKIAVRSLQITLDALFSEFSREWNRRNLPRHTIKESAVDPTHVERLGKLLGVSFGATDDGIGKGKERA